MQLEVLDDGRVMVIARGRAIQLSTAQGAPPQTMGKLEVAVFGEVDCGNWPAMRSSQAMAGSAFFLGPLDDPKTIRLSRCTIPGDALVNASEIEMLSDLIATEGAIHMGGRFYMNGSGNHWIGTGNHCPPIPELPVDFRAG